VLELELDSLPEDELAVFDVDESMMVYGNDILITGAVF